MKRNLGIVFVLLLVFALATSAVYAKPSDPLDRESCTLAEVASCTNNLHPPTRMGSSMTFSGFWTTLGSIITPTVGTQIGGGIGSSSSDDNDDA